MSKIQSVTAPAKHWIAALNRLTPAMAGARKPIPILNHILITPEALTIAGYNYETSAVTSIEDANGSGEPFLVVWRWLLDAIRSASGKAKDAPVTLAVEDKKITVSARGYELHSEAVPVADYPAIPQADYDAFISVPSGELRTALRGASTASSKDETFPILGVVQVAFDDDGMQLLATDRYRLAAYHVAGQSKGAASFLLNARAIKALDRFLVGGDVVIGLRENRITIKTEHAIYTSLSVDGDYPKIRSLFPTSVTASFDVDRSVLVEAVKVAERMSEQHAPCTVRLFGGGAEVTFDYGLFGPSRAPLAAGVVAAGADDEVTLAIKPRYLIEALLQLPGDTVRISYTSTPKPFLLSPGGVDADDPHTPKHLIMPVRMPS